MPLNFELLRIIIALVGTAIAARQDYKTSYIDDKILYAMAGTGALLTIASLDFNFIAYTFAVAAMIFLLGYVFYKKGQLGMGDVFLFIALQLLIPFQPAISSQNFFASTSIFSEAFQLPAGFEATFNFAKHSIYFFTLFLFSSYFATIGSALQFALKLKGRKLKPNKLIAALSAAVLAAALYFLQLFFGFSVLTFFFLVLLLSSLFFLTFKEQIMREIIVQRIPISKIEDEDVLVVEEMQKELVKKYGLGRVLTKKEVAKLKEIEKKEGVHAFPVMKDLPRFGPYVLLALLAALLFGDLFSVLSKFLS